MRTWTLLPPDLTRRLAALGLALCLSAEALAAQTPGTPPMRRPRPASQTQLDQSRRTAIVDAAQRVNPSVVSITVDSRQPARGRSAFDLFFLPPGGDRTVQSFGTGFVYRADGYIITNQHVVADAEQVRVSLPDGTDVPGTVVGADPLADIAVVKVDRARLKVPAFGASSGLMIGEWVVALGNPFGYLLGDAHPTVTAGVVSAIGRNILPSGEQTGLYLDMIQTDAAINPGNSGGPLANADGEIVGVNSSIFTQGGGSIGLGFAIPIERARRVADEIIRTGQVRRAWWGVEVAGAESMRDWRTQGGVTVTSVTPDGPADKAGLRRGDVLLRANGRELRNFLDWEAVKLDRGVGDTLQVQSRALAFTRTRTLISGDLPTVTAERVRVLSDLELATVTAGIRAERNIRSEAGALILSVTPAAAQATGLAAGDVIIAIDRTPVRSAEQVAEIVGALKPRQPIRVYVERGGRLVYSDIALR
ncbi:MAG: trypsin-like peptidase domain-containing protein [Gemmatimonadales bacterium]